MSHIEILNNAIHGARAPAPAPAAVPTPDPVFPMRFAEAAWQTVPSVTPPPPAHLNSSLHSGHAQSAFRWRIQRMAGDMILLEVESMVHHITRHIFRKRDVLSVISRAWGGDGIPAGGYRTDEVVISLKKAHDYPQRIKVSFGEAVNSIEFQRQLMVELSH